MTVPAPLVVSTRPADRGHALLAQLRAAGAQAVAMPVMAIRPVPARPGLLPADVMVFTSVAAVAHGAALVRGASPVPLLVAVGAATRAALEDLGLHAICPPDGADSEAMLALEEVARLGAGHVVTIVRGRGGRELLARTLAAQGVTVQKAEVYERVAEPFDAGPLARALAADRPTWLLISSVAGLVNLLAGLPATMLPAVHARSTVITYSERIADRVRAAGFEQPVLVVPPGDDAAVVACVRRMS